MNNITTIRYNQVWFGYNIYNYCGINIYYNIYDKPNIKYIILHDVII